MNVHFNSLIFGTNQPITLLIFTPCGFDKWHSSPDNSENLIIKQWLP